MEESLTGEVDASEDDHIPCLDGAMEPDTYMSDQGWAI